MTNCLCFGDSITYGEYDGVLGGWVDRLKRICHEAYYNGTAREVNCYNLGIGGETTTGLLRRLAVELDARLSPAENLVLLAYGVNDLAIQEGAPIVPMAVYRQQLIEAIKLIKKRTDKIYLLSVLPISNDIDGVVSSSGKKRTNKAILDYNKVLKEVATSEQVNYVDLHTAFFDEKELLLSNDRIHPNDNGYDLIANILKSLLQAHF